jgi:hypoxanthine-DNA glycosylase
VLSRPRLTLLRGLPPIAGPRAHVLVLGSFPGARSLAEAQYYAHPQNRFWRAVAPEVGCEPDAPYVARTDALCRAGVALWDVLASCQRLGSLDSAIVPGSEIPNDLDALLEQQPSLQRVLFNGRKAAEMFARLVVPEEYWPDLGVTLRVLPSTSPANAAVRLDALRLVWSDALRV